ncbi:MAG: hypothetical protein Q9193_000888 [Seirophora villosa]
MMPFPLAGSRVYIVLSVFAFLYFLIVYYLPLYFQVIDGVSVAMNGVQNLPLMLGVTVSMVASGAYISVTGIAAAILVFRTALLRTEQALGGRIGKSPLDTLRQAVKMENFYSGGAV